MRANNDVSIIKALVILGEFILINLAFYLNVIITEYTSLYSCFVDNKNIILLFNLSYFISISTFGIILHKRMVRIEEIFDKVVKLIILQVLILGACTLILSKIHDFPLIGVIRLFAIEFLLLITWRIFMRIASKYCRAGNRKSVIILGAGNIASQVHTNIIKNIHNSYKLDGFFDDRSESEFVLEEKLFKGTLNNVIPYLKEHKIDEIFCALPAGEDRKAVPILNYAENNLIRFYFIPDFKRFLSKKVNLQFIDNIPIVFIRSEPLESYTNRFFKRLFDIIASFIFLITVFPWLLIILGTAIKLSSRGPIFFMQKRTGKNGKEFTCIKFRSMNINKEANEKQASKDDSRITAIGALLRKTNLDETPQFLNVLTGDMSIVGPRPHMLKQTEEYSHLIDKYMLRHLAKPGITGLAQITGCRGETRNVQEMEKRIQRDVWYLENWTFWVDIKIIFQTVILMIKGDENAY